MKGLEALLLCLALPAPARALDLSKAVVTTPAALTAREKRAVAMLIDEVGKRTGILWPVAPAGSPAVVVRRASRPGPAEGYRISAAGAAVTIEGNDERGVLFGLGRLLRAMRMESGAVSLPDGFKLASAPRYPLRGHQLGYRPKTNSYDAWAPAAWEQYIRDLAVFGANAVELIPPRSDDDASSPHFPLPPMEMMVRMSRLLDDYGLDVWIWYPAMEPDYENPATVEKALAEWGEVFRDLPRVDAVFVPGGDPGHTQPKHLMALLEKQTGVLRRYHPKAQMWVSPQGFNQEWMDEFIGILRHQEPAWLAGVVFGPQIRASLPELRKLVPGRYPIRHYPDITHSLRCQYPVPDWDTAYAVTEGREPINPRPLGQARIFRLLQPYTIGFLTYSEGCNDDVNKTLWSALGWDPDADTTEVLREYSRYFIGERYRNSFAQGLLALERNWQGPLAANAGVYTTLGQFQALERAASPGDLKNWRFQQALYRAYYDASVRRRLIEETAAEERAMEALGRAASAGTPAALAEAERLLDVKPGGAWRARVFELAEALFQSIGMQLSVERYQAIAVDRGANLDSIDTPLNDRVWLAGRFAEIRKLAEEPARLAAVDTILQWTNPGPGGFYDDLGDPANQPHLVRGNGFDLDPAFLESTLVGFGAPGAARVSWWNHAEPLNDAPMRMRYTGLDRAQPYKVRVVYAGETTRGKIRLEANGLEVHPWMEKPVPFRPVEFDVPAPATADGELTLTWRREPGRGGNGRGCQVAEVWLMRK